MPRRQTSPSVLVGRKEAVRLLVLVGLAHGATAGPCPMSLTPGSLPPARANVGYRERLVPSGGTPPYQLAVVAGALPGGLALAADGLLSGRPLAAGGSGFTVEAADTTGCRVRASYTLAVTPTPDLLAAPGPSPASPPRVRLFEAFAGVPTLEIAAYATPGYGAEVAGGNVDGGPEGEILTAPGPGAIFGPHVRAFVRDGAPLPGGSFYAYGTLRGGARVAAADVAGSAVEQVLTAPGPLSVFAPHVRGFSLHTGAPQPLPGLSFFAYPGASYGALVAGGDITATAPAEIVTGPGPGAGYPARVRAFSWSGSGVVPLARADFPALPGTTHGAAVACGDADGDGRAEMAAAGGGGPGATSRIAGFVFDGTAVTPAPGFDVTPFPTSYGARPGFGEIAPRSDDGRCDLVAGPGPDPAAPASLRAFAWDGAALAAIPWSIAAFPGTPQGLVPSGGESERRLWCNGQPEGCDRTYDQVCQACTHNAMASEEDGFWLPTPNQKWSFRRQLDDGVRCMMLDTYMEQGEPALCHAHCGLGSTPWVPMLRDLDAWLAAHPYEVVTFILESYITEAETLQALRDAGIEARLYHHRAPPGSPWPPLRALLESGQRLVVFTDDAAANGDWHLDWRRYGWETPYDDPTFTCQHGRGDPTAYDHQVFILNHYVNCPYGGCETNGILYNDLSFMLPRAASCWQFDAGENPWTQIPTFLNVDHYHVPAPGGAGPRADVFDVVRALNLAWPSPP